MSTKQTQSSISYFASFFKNYATALAVTAASLPAVNSFIDLFPLYSSLKEVLSIFTSFSCFLSIAILYSLRRKIARKCFPKQKDLGAKDYWTRSLFKSGIPLILALIFMLSSFTYLVCFDKSLIEAALIQSTHPSSTEVNKWLLEAVNEHPNKSKVGTLFGQTTIVAEKVTTSDGDYRYYVKNITRNIEQELLEKTPLNTIPRKHQLTLLYTLLFFSSASSFVWFGLVEYAQQKTRVSDEELIENPYQIANENS